MPFLGNIGTGEMIIIGIVLILIFGNKKMNEIAKDLGQSTKEFKKTKEEWQKTVNNATTEVNKATSDFKENIKDTFDLDNTPDKPTKSTKS